MLGLVALEREHRVRAVLRRRERDREVRKEVFSAENERALLGEDRPNFEFGTEVFKARFRDSQNLEIHRNGWSPGRELSFLYTFHIRAFDEVQPKTLLGDFLREQAARTAAVDDRSSCVDPASSSQPNRQFRLSRSRVWNAEARRPSGSGRRISVRDRSHRQPDPPHCARTVFQGSQRPQQLACCEPQSICLDTAPLPPLVAAAQIPKPPRSTPVWGRLLLSASFPRCKGTSTRNFPDFDLVGKFPGHP